MHPDPAAPASEMVFTIAYQQFTRSEYNAEFTGTGTLTIRPDGPVYVFSGRPRRFLPGGSLERTLRPEDIAGVSVSGREIRFIVRSWRSDAAEKPFIFFGRDAQEAAAIAKLLPDATVAPPTSAQTFLARLEQSGDTRSPWLSVTNALIAANVASFVILAAFFGAGWFQVESMRPYVDFAANNGAATTGGEWWRLLTAMFTHYGLLHLLLNMWALHQAGLFLEKLQGRWPYLLTYFASGLAGGFSSIAWHGAGTWSAGASGAVFGVYGAILGHMIRQKGTVPPAVFQSILKSSLAFGFYNLVYGLANPAIDQAAHLGGAAGGLLFGWLLGMPLEPEARRPLLRPRLRAGALALAALVTVGVAATPRFNYNIREEIAWENANKEIAAGETPLMQQFTAALKDIERGRPATTHTAWISSTLIPFYERWARVLDTLHFTPGLRTEQRRTMLAHAIATRLASLQHLVETLPDQPADALKRFGEENAVFTREIEAITKLGEES